MSKVVIINGSGGVGKDTFVELCSKYCNVINISSVHIIKRVARDLGWNGGKTEKDRKFLSDLKLLADGYNDHSHQYIKESIEKMGRYSNVDVLFIMLRDIEDIQRFKNEFPTIITLLIKNKNVGSILSNPADANVENFKYDCIVDNDSTVKDLDKVVCSFVKGILK
jgi:hypothetical protein